MKKIIAATLTALFLVAIVATPSYNVNSPTLNTESVVFGNKDITGGVTTQ